MPICIPWSTELLPDLAVCVAQGSAKVSSQPSQAQGIFGRADQALLLDARMAIPGGAATELGAGELIQLVWAQPYCIHAGRASSAAVLHALAFEAGMLTSHCSFHRTLVSLSEELGFFLFGYFSDVTKNIMNINLLYFLVIL